MQCLAGRRGKHIAIQDRFFGVQGDETGSRVRAAS
jgi:hypothetical protein